MSVIIGNGIAILLVAALIVLSAREIWKSHQSGGCGGCSGNCAGCSSSCHSCGSDRKSQDLSGKKYAVNGEIVRLDELTGSKKK